MANSDTRGVRHVKCPRCQSVLQEPGVPVYQCGGCGATLRAKNRSGESPSRSGLPPTQSRHSGSGDVASTSSTPEGNSGRRIERKEEHEQSTNRGVHRSSEFPSQRYAGDAESRASSPSISHNRGSKDATSELQADAEKRSECQVELPDASTKKHSGDQAAEPQPTRDVAPAAAGGKAPSPPRHELQAEDLAPLRQKIMKTVDELRGDLSELFRKSPDLNPTTTTRPRPPRLPNKPDGHAPARGAAASTLPSREARRHVAAVGAARAMKPGQVIAAPAPPPRGLPSRRYRRCRADPCCDDVQQPRPCHHGCCRHSSKPECSSCRGHCCRPVRAPRKQPPAAANKRRPPPRHHCRPVLKGAPFIICSSCFKLVQVPADFAVATNRLRKLRCGSCAAVLSYSYRDPARKKPVDEFGTDGSDQVRGGGGGKGCDDDPFAPFVDAFGLSSYSTTEDEQTPQLHVSRNTSLDTVDGAKAVGRLHRLMGYGSASELLRHSPDLCESFGERTSTPDYDRKGKGVCVDDAEDDGDLDDSDDEDDSGVLKRSAARGAVWPLPGHGAIRIKS